MRVLHVIGRMHRGGAETLIMNWYRAGDRARIQFDFAVLDPGAGEYESEIRELGGRLYRLPNPRTAPLRFARALLDLCSAYDPFAAVHSHVHRFSGIVLALAAVAGVPVRVAHSHTTCDGNERRRPVYRYLTSILIHLCATRLLACSLASGRHLFGSASVADPRFSVLRNAVAADLFLPAPPRERHSSHGPVFSHVGSFTASKNHACLLAIFAEVRKLSPAAQLWLIGDGPLRPGIEAEIGRLGLAGSVVLFGVRSNVSTLLAQSDVFVMPSLFEGVPLALIEAQLAGLPAVVSDLITPEADLGAGLVNPLPLAAGPEAWAATALAAAKTPRRPASLLLEALRTTGYDVHSAVHRLAMIYAGAETGGSR